MVLSRFLPAALSAAAMLALGAAAAHAEDNNPNVIHASRHDVSAPMRDILANMPPQAPLGTEQEPYLVPNILLKPTNRASALVPDYSSVQQHAINVPAPGVDLSFDGISSTTSGCGCLPPDTNGDISEHEYIQWVNSSWQIFDKATGLPNPATPVPKPGSSFFVGFGGKCETTNSGDPIALWDARAKRWVMTQFVTSAPYAQCVAVSTTSDPLGTYNRYEFRSTNFGDYPKLGVWSDESKGQDAYLLTTHEFDAGSNFVGAALTALQRDKMLIGDPTAAVVHFGGYDAYGVQPINLTGTLDAPGNSCPSFVHFDANTSDYLFWDLCLNWAAPASSTITSPTDPTRIAGKPFAPYYNEVPEPGTTAGLDSFGSNTMYRANARAFAPEAPTRISLVINHVVQGTVQQGGIDWVHFNLKPTNIYNNVDRIFADNFDGVPAPLGAPAPTTKRIVDEGIFAPDADNRWMGSVAMDGSGNIGVGYSKSSATTYPQIEISGRTLDDPASTLRDEQSCTDGIANGSQTHTANRWGDYSSMSVDPIDQCTFYFTSEYYPTTTTASWHTRVCTFKFAGCGDPNYALVAESPARVQMCGAAATDPTYSLRAGVLNGFSAPVLLTANGVPVGTTPTFSPNPLVAPGTSTLTLGGGASLPSGDYAFSVDATSGALTRSIALQLGISAMAPGAPTLTAPADAAAGVKIHPALSWTAVPGALSYTVQVATDAGFTAIVASTTVTTPAWTVTTTLSSTTLYYWRVTPNNYCGGGIPSSTFSFTTGVPGQCPVGSTATTVFLDDFQSGVNGWTTDGAGATNWAQMTAPAGIGLSTTVWGIPDNSTTSDRGLISPAIALPAGSQGLILSFDTYHSFEVNTPTSCWDNGTMEIKAGSGAFSYLDGSRLFTDPYDGIVSGGEANAGAMAWCHAPASAIHSIVDLDGFDGQSVNLRWRAVSDSNGVATTPVTGMYIDNVKVEACQ